MYMQYEIMIKRNFKANQKLSMRQTYVFESFILLLRPGMNIGGTHFWSSLYLCFFKEFDRHNTTLVTEITRSIQGYSIWMSFG